MGSNPTASALTSGFTSKPSVPVSAAALVVSMAARGHIRQRSNGSYEVLVYAGRDPLTGRERRRTGTAHTRKGAEQLRTRLLSGIDQGRTGGGSKATLAEILERLLETVDLELTTRYCYEQYIASKILPALGHVQARRITVEVLDRFYAELRKRGGARGQPLAAMTVRQIHFIIRAALNLAVKWEWIPSNPAEKATIPRYVRQEVAPPTPEEVAQLIEAAWARDPDLGVFLWTAVVTGARRGEVCGLRWSHVRLEAGYLVIARSLAQRGQLREGEGHQDSSEPAHRPRQGHRRDPRRAQARCEQRAVVCPAPDLRAAQVLAKSLPRPPSGNS